MASWTAHSLFTFGGELNTNTPDKEIWQCGVRLGSSGMGGQIADPDAFLDYAAPLMSAWWSDTGTSKAPASCTLKWLKLGQIGTDGKYTDTVGHVHDYTTPVAGVASATIPDILGLAVSWVTGITVRKGNYASHGRIYLPFYSAPTSPAGSIRTNNVFAAAVRDQGKALLTLLNDAPQPVVPIVASSHGGAVHTITGVRVGDVIDVQRRRKDALQEVYYGAVFP